MASGKFIECPGCPVKNPEKHIEHCHFCYRSELGKKDEKIGELEATNKALRFALEGLAARLEKAESKSR